MTHERANNSMSVEEAVAAGIIADPDAAGGATPAAARSKYGVASKAERTRGPRVYASKGEMGYADQLYLRLQADGGDLLIVTEQPIFILGDDTTYRPDFLIMTDSGAVQAIDFKGAETAEFKRIKKLWAKYGQCPLMVMVKHGDGFMTREVVWPPDGARYTAQCRNCSKPRPGPEPLGTGARARAPKRKGGGSCA